MSGHTKGPWAWFGNAKGNNLYLATPDRGRLYIMAFRRWGMSGAQPAFRHNDRMVDASELIQFEVGNRDVVGTKAAKADDSVYRFDVRGIANADARLIAAAPDLLEALELIVDTYGFDPSINSSIWQTAFAALAKAKGEAP